MNTTPVGEIRPNSAEIAASIVETIGTLAVPDDPITMPRWKLERLLIEAAERGAAAGGRDDGLTVSDLEAAIADISLTLGQVSCLMQCLIEADGIQDSFIFQNAIGGLKELVETAFDHTDLIDLASKKRKATSSADTTTAP